MTIVEEIELLKRERNATILAHYYTNPEVQDIADYVGDSLELSQMAAETDADVILFAGVKFMAETAAIISPKKKVIIPDISAGCSLADSIKPEDIREWRRANPDGVVVSYVNTTAEVKAETDICCTSANAVEIVDSIPRNKKVLFTPDWNLGNYIALSIEREMEIWRGNCHVHQRFSSEKLLAKAEKYPDAELLVHPESAASQHSSIIDNPRVFILSTSGIIRRIQESNSDTFIIVTEEGILHQLKQRYPDRKFIHIESNNKCSDMKLATLENIRESLKTLEHQVVVPDHIRKKAYPSIERMLNFKRAKN